MFERLTYLIVTQRVRDAVTCLDVSEAMSQVDAQRRLTAMPAEDRAVSCIVPVTVSLDASDAYGALIRHYETKIAELRELAERGPDGHGNY